MTVNEPVLRVEFMNGKSHWYPITPGKGWKIDPMWRLLLINSPGWDRISVPLDNVAAIQVERT